ncbi:OmpA family protein [Rivibacter subsaxonicus]|uniref:Outer membrane protein OmpA-like peptidoglycan-associated protein n=1 Tax=Rivibacter subsaxonicus TaxID=457575 RepID=A0A4Q7W1I8_9BURK|nr:OmpA family protein [Rivibacter subsaxonicus]RZU03144.1 outer membrane protein OmpA-like peptidoglycan-associated protein [Rivibacter subsaxonicus]
MIVSISRTKTLAAASAVALLIGGCANMDETQATTAKGAGLGALGGAVLGQVIGGDTKATMIGAGIGAAAGAIGANVWSKNMEEKKRAMEQSTQGTGIEVTRTADNQLKLAVPSDISFAVGSAAIEPRLRPVLDSFANGLAAEPNMLVKVVGHTDSTGSDAINDPLSHKRADSVRYYLEDRGIKGARVETAGRGSREPVAGNDSAEGRAKNRRVEIFLREPAKS